MEKETKQTESTDEKTEQDVQVKKNIYQKIAAVMEKTKTVAKRGHNDFHNYDYATEADILAEVRQHLIEVGLVIIPAATEVVREGSLTTAYLEYQIIDTETGETITCKWIGSGEDKGDKGAYKAFTGGNKYFLMKLFQLPTGDDPETGNGETNDSSPKENPLTHNPEGETCKHCGSANLRPTESKQDKGRFYWRCLECPRQESFSHWVEPKKEAV